MKKYFITFIMLSTTVLSMNAQLRVNSLGRVLVGDSTGTLTAGMTVNRYGTHTGSSSVLSSIVGFKAMTLGNTKDNTAVCGEASNTPATSSPSLIANYSPLNCGVYGLAGNNVMNIGVQGGLKSNVAQGAGVYGTSLPAASTLCDNKYAGFFEGDARVTGVLQGFLTNYVDKHPYTSTAMTDVLEYVADITVLKSDRTGIIPLLQGGDVASPEAIHPSNQLTEEHHAILDVQSVKTALPFLILKDQQNVEYVNYTELIPVLLKAIQELKAQVDALSGNSTGGTVMMAPMQGETSSVDNVQVNGAKLYQNRPNPFTSQTEIRFALPSDARDAYICIFDMTGKMLKRMPVTSAMESVSVNGYELGDGIYLYSLVVNGQEIDTKRMIVTK